MSRMAAGGMLAFLPASGRRVTSGALGYFASVKTMFWVYFLLIWGGIAYFSVIGLTHH
jgi:hypothetical protein